MVPPARTPLRLDRLRALNLPSSVEVSLDEWGRPTEIVEDSAEGRKKVETVVEEWKIDDEWWRTPIHRRYVEVVLEGGAHVVLFEDLVSSEWFMQRP
jgi:hypothetical protein